MGYDKYSVEKKQQSTDGGTTWTDVTPLQTRNGSLIEENSADCGYNEPQYRFTKPVIICIGYDRHEQSKEQVSYDGGNTWEDTGKIIDNLIEENSVYCGYVPPTPGGYENQYLTFEALEDGTFTFIGINSNSLSYSLDDGHTWTALASGTASPTVTSGNKIMWKGTCTPVFSGSGKFSSTGTFNTYGNAMSIVHGDNFRNSTTISDYQFKNLFKETKVVNAENLVLSATTLAYECYQFMFQGCTSLTRAPELPATTLAYGCYQYMFYGCTSLTTAPELPAETLATNCYSGMFDTCKSLTTAPELPATTLADSCYDDMFNGCTSLTSAPELPATTLAYGCYSQMFNNCTSLVNAPVLPATTLATYCYFSMFYGCTSLTTAPELPATTLADLCYRDMFRGCTGLNYIKCLATDISASECTSNWVSGVASSGTFVKAASMTSWTTDTSGIPTGWTVINQ